MSNDLLRDLVDERDVIAAIHELFIRTDQRDWPAVRSCFADAVIFDMTSLAGGAPKKLSPTEIAQIWEAGLTPLDSVHHQAGNFKVRLQGEEAEAFCYGIAFHSRRVASGKNTRTFVGSYDFGLRRAGLAWKIHRFKFTAKFVDGNAQLEREDPG